MCLQAGPAALVKLLAKSANIDANTIKIQKPPITSIISCHETKRKGEKGLPKRNRLRSLLEDYRFSSFSFLVALSVTYFVVSFVMYFFLLKLFFYWDSWVFSLLFLFPKFFKALPVFLGNSCVSTQLYRVNQRDVSWS